MQMTWSNAVSAKYCGTMCDSASLPQTGAGWSASYAIPIDKLGMRSEDASLMSSDNMSWLDDSISENREALRLLSE